jgi:hypothetical protein
LHPHGSDISYERVFIGITAQEAIQILHATKVRADRNILHSTAMHVGLLCFIPGTAILFPGDVSGRRRQVNIHVRALELSDLLVHVTTLSRKFSQRITETLKLI